MKKLGELFYQFKPGPASPPAQVKITEIAGTGEVGAQACTRVFKFDLSAGEPTGLEAKCDAQLAEGFKLAGVCAVGTTLLLFFQRPPGAS